MMQCGSSLAVLLLSVMVVSLSSHLVAGAWAFQTRSSCGNTYGDCSNEWGCCSLNDVCVTLHDEVLDETISFVPRRCQPIQRYQNALPRNARCNDSRECYDRCCQVYRGFRYGTSYRCGSQNEGRIAHDCVVQYFNQGGVRWPQTSMVKHLTLGRRQTATEVRDQGSRQIGRRGQGQWDNV